MKYNFTSLNIEAVGKDSVKAATYFAKEIKVRTGKSLPVFEKAPAFPKIIFITDNSIDNKDFFEINQTEGEIIITAKTIRGLIFGYSLFLRKCTFSNGVITLIKNISGKYSPQKKIRGHQVGYRTTPNTYDAWNYEQYFRYYLDMMAFGSNTVEHNGTRPKGNFKNRLMKYGQEEFLAEASRLADTVDLDVSLWQANNSWETEEEALAQSEKLYADMPRLNIVFPPGGDPGELPADEFLERCKKTERILKKYHPHGKVQPSAQAPHSIKDWGEVFCKGLQNEPEEINAVIMGPNHAFPIHELRKRIPEKYPMRFYPDITHNLRCEYPVNFQQDDWHYSLAATLSRESVNPRPTELRTLHRIFSPYTIGSVSYSEGVHDDLNKAVWSALEWDCNTDLREIVLDYVRLFMYGADEEKITDCIFLLEKNWQGAPEENPCIDLCYKMFCELLKEYPALSGNWRFLQLYFRACCDKLVKMRRVFELKLCKDATEELKNHRLSSALEILNTPFNFQYSLIRSEIGTLAEKLFELIGLQLDVEHYCADSWERGAVLETIDNNVTDKAFLIKKIEYALTLNENEKNAFIDRLISCRSCNNGEIYFSVALHGLNTLGTCQSGEFYMDVYADKPIAKELSMPMSMTKVYDHFSFKALFGGFKADMDYTLKIAYKTDINPQIEHHRVIANGVTVYDGKQYGGKKDPAFDREMLAEGFESAEYTLPKNLFINGTLELEIKEDIDGFKLCELWLKPVK